MATTLKSFGNLLNPGPRQMPTGRQQIDWTHPLANGLTFATLYNGDTTEDISGRSGVPPIFIHGSVSARTMTSEGPAWKPGNSFYGSANVKPPLSTGQQFSIYTRIARSGNSSEVDLCGILRQQSPWRAWAIATLGGAGLQTRAGLRWSGPGDSQVNGSTTIPNNTIGSFSASFQVGGNNFLYVNGVLDLTVSFGTSTPPPDVGTSTILVAYQDYGANAKVCDYMWTRVLSASEMAWIHQEPYCFLMPAQEEDTALRRTPFAIFNPHADPFRLRIQVANDDAAAAAAQPFELYASKNGGAYAPVTTTSTMGVKSNDSGSDTDETTISVPRLTPAS